MGVRCRQRTNQKESTQCKAGVRILAGSITISATAEDQTVSLRLEIATQEATSVQLFLLLFRFV